MKRVHPGTSKVYELIPLEVLRRLQKLPGTKSIRGLRRGEEA